MTSLYYTDLLDLLYHNGVSWGIIHLKMFFKHLYDDVFLKDKKMKTGKERESLEKKDLNSHEESS